MSKAGACFLCFMVYLAIGIVCIVFYNNNPTPCGIPGYPPLREWILGTGIAYCIIGFISGIFGIFLTSPDFLLISRNLAATFFMWSAIFTFTWMIVGAVSLWRDGSNCITYNFPLWQMGIAAVIISMFLFVWLACVACHIKPEPFTSEQIEDVDRPISDTIV